MEDDRIDMAKKNRHFVTANCGSNGWNAKSHEENQAIRTTTTVHGAHPRNVSFGQNKYYFWIMQSQRSSLKLTPKGGKQSQSGQGQPMSLKWEISWVELAIIEGLWRIF